MIVAIRTDASVSMGTGHLMRCLSLAALLQERGAHTVFLSRALPPGLAALVVESGSALHGLDGAPGSADAPFAVEGEDDARQVRGWAEGRGGVHAVVVDHYGLDARWERAVRGACRRLLVIDDLADRPHDADLLLDHNLWRDGAARYARWIPAGCRPFVGPQYALLRAEFAAARARWPRRAPEAVERVLVNFGGADPGDMTARALEVLAAHAPTGLHVDAVVGAAYPHRERLLARWEGAPTVTLHAQTRRMAELMARADLAIGAGGTTSWERCALGLPALLTAIARNQEEGLEALAEAGACRYLGPVGELDDRTLGAAVAELLADPSAVARMSAASLALGVGESTSLVVDELLS